MYSKYVQPVKSYIIRELEKRGVTENKQDPTTGVVTKQTNANKMSSAYGWGAVDDTIPVSRKNLESFRRNFVSIMNEVIISHALEKVPEKPAATKAIRSLPSSNPPDSKRIKVAPPALQRWHTYCVDRYNGGSVGMVPECYQSNGLPSLEELMETNIGTVMAHFCSFIKKDW